MYERFTDRARKVMQLANQAAQQLNHEYVSTEHILLGLIREGSGIAAYALKELGLDLPKIRAEVEKVVKPGPEMITMGRLPQTPRARKVIEAAIEEASALQHNYVGTEHMLLGLLHESEGPAFQVLTGLGLNADMVRGAVMHMLGQSRSKESNESPRPSMPLEPIKIEDRMPQADRERRFRLYHLHPQSLVSIFNGDAEVVRDRMPNDSRIVNIGFSFAAHHWTILVSSMSFDSVPDGQYVPEAESGDGSLQLQKREGRDGEPIPSASNAPPSSWRDKSPLL